VCFYCDGVACSSENILLSNQRVTNRKKNEKKKNTDSPFHAISVHRYAVDWEKTGVRFPAIDVRTRAEMAASLYQSIDVAGKRFRDSSCCSVDYDGRQTGRRRFHR
jgi:hypothetical protein